MKTIISALDVIAVKALGDFIEGININI